jgi:hypothetical protein
LHTVEQAAHRVEQLTRDIDELVESWKLLPLVKSLQALRGVRTGNGHLRRVLGEAAWAYRFRPSMSTAIRERNAEVPQPIRDIAWTAQERLHRRYARMSGRGIRNQKTVTAIDRELTGFVWAIGEAQQALAA